MVTATIQSRLRRKIRKEVMMDSRSISEWGKVPQTLAFAGGLVLLLKAGFSDEIVRVEPAAWP